MSKYLDTLKLNSEEFLNKYPHQHWIYDFINTCFFTSIGMVAGFIFAGAFK